MIFLNISRRVVVNVLINTPPSNNFLKILLSGRFHQTVKPLLTAVSDSRTKLIYTS